MVRLTVADDHALVREGLLAILSRQADLEVLAEADDGSTALRQILELRPDVALLDQSMPMLVGIDVIKEARGLGSETKFIVLTMHTEPYLSRQALHAGAHGVVVKDDAATTLLQAIERVHAGKTYVSPSVDPSYVGVEELLTEREREILIWVARGLSNAEIADELGISPRTVDTHRTRLMRKVGTHSVAELVSFAARSGLIQL